MGLVPIVDTIIVCVSVALGVEYMIVWCARNIGLPVIRVILYALQRPPFLLVSDSLYYILF